MEGKFTNTEASLFNLIKELKNSGLNVVIFGGWSVELQNFKKPWQHGDIDLLLIDTDFRSLIRLIDERSWKICKSYLHKRAFLIDGVMVELFLVTPSGDNFMTRFVGNKGTYDFVWPKNLIVEKKINDTSYQLASKAAMDKYADEHKKIHSLSPWN